MLSLRKKIESNWKGYANMRVPVKVLLLMTNLQAPPKLQFPVLANSGV